MAQRKLINDRYELQRLPVAHGGMGEVWAGRDTKLDREVAVKFIRFPEGAPDQELIRRFVRESRITARLRHPGVPAVFDVGTDDGRPYLVMEYVHGLSISDLLARHQRLPVGWCAAIAAQTCAVLVVAHQASLIHRDLKPSNLMLEPDGTVKVLDFGLAVGLDLADMSQITRLGQNIGTPAYMAPEQVLAAMSGPRTDLYALGCTLHEMLTGQQLFTGATAYSVMRQQVDDPPVSARSIRSDIPAELDTLLGALLAKKPEDRPDSALQTYELLLPFITAVDLLPANVQPPSVPRPVRMYAQAVSRVFDVTGSNVVQPSAAARSVDTRKPDRTTQPEHPATRQRVARVWAEANELVRKDRRSQAAELLAETVRAATEAFGPLDSEVVNLRLDWATVLFEVGDYRAASPVYHSLAVDLGERDGSDTEVVFHCRLHHATCRALLGDTRNALNEMHNLLADQQRVFGLYDSRTIDLRRQIGLLQLGAGQRSAAQKTLRKLLNDLLQIHGAEHPAVTKVQDLLAGLPDDTNQ
ncbi:serine/threonine-protein kinase [Actinocrispum sp. NPDC049592]|uniref:serine/threonine-protein kinase n=1 Tax=Actinocrispum sp. NPDC049592 TaxID=3154835 RepID=UPI003449D7E5